MQSYLVYKRLGQSVRRQVNDTENARGRSTSRLSAHSTAQAPLSDENADAEPPTPEAREPVEEEKERSPDSEKEAVDTDTDTGPPRNTPEYKHYALEGVQTRDRKLRDGKTVPVHMVSWDGPDDPFNPHNYPRSKKIRLVMTISFMGFIVTMASSVDSGIIPQAAADFGVSEVVESMSTANFLLGFAVGSLFAGPLSEILGRNPVYIGSLVSFMAWTLGSALSPNIGAQLTFRFLAGFSGSPALTMVGGTIADIFDPVEKTWGFPLFAIPGFGGPILGPIIAAWIGPSPLISWRWTEWVSLIGGGLALILLVLTLPETFSQRLLHWKAYHFRQATGDEAFRASHELDEKGVFQIVKHNLARPFILVRTELIIILMTLYFAIIYIVMFTFFVGYPNIFQDVYGVSQGITFTIFVAMLIGVFAASILVPIVWHITKRHIAKREAAGLKGIEPEQRLWFAMLGGSLSMPIGLFWMAWTDYKSVSIWSPIVASSLFGFGIICVFTSGYMYIIDAYEIYAASALTFVAVVRYLAAGGMTVVGIPFYGNVGPHWTMTILGILALLMAPVPYALYIWGHKVRKHSKFAVNKSD